MNKSEISAPIRTANGWHIVRLSDRKPSSVRALPEVRDQLVASMRLRKAQEGERSYIESLVSKSSVAVNQVELQKLQAAKLATEPTSQLVEPYWVPTGLHQRVVS